MKLTQWSRDMLLRRELSVMVYSQDHYNTQELIRLRILQGFGLLQLSKQYTTNAFITNCVQLFLVMKDVDTSRNVQNYFTA